MKPGETIRFACGDCQIVFDLCLAPASERAMEAPEELAGEDLDPTCCPFCGAHAASELKALNDRPTYTA